MFMDLRSESTLLFSVPERRFKESGKISTHKNHLIQVSELISRARLDCLPGRLLTKTNQTILDFGDLGKS